jgi:glycerol-3-phosphate dehydrogenase
MMPAQVTAVELRASLLRTLGQTDYDVLIVGGGINGAVAAAALATQGARVALLEQGDFASGTSQQSSNLIWGGIKYLESYQFGLVARLCRSRNRLLASYPTTLQEIRFFVSLEPAFRQPLWLVWAGTWLYWLIGNGYTRLPHWLSRHAIQQREPLIDPDRGRGGVEYSDAWLPDGDARFVFGFIRTALDHGAQAVNYVQSLGARRVGEHWLTSARDVIGGAELTLRSRVLINAAGPWVDECNRSIGQTTRHRHVFSKGVHLIVPQLTPRPQVLTFFASDGRLFFAIPLGPRTCIGTTDTPVNQPQAQVTEDDRRFILDNINRWLRLPRPLTHQDIIAERCGVRPLVVSGAATGTQDWLQLSRRHVIEVDRQTAHISLFGGKLTDCLNIGEELVHQVASLNLPLPQVGRRWYGEPAAAEYQDFLRQAAALGLNRDGLPQRLWRRYGAATAELLALIRADAGDAEELADIGYLRAELRLAAGRELIVTLDDFLRRRTQLAQVYSRSALQAMAGLREACALLFGAQAEARWQDYFADPPV